MTRTAIQMASENGSTVRRGSVKPHNENRLVVLTRCVQAHLDSPLYFV